MCDCAKSTANIDQPTCLHGPNINITTPHNFSSFAAVSNKTYIDEPWASGGRGKLKDSPRVVVLHDDNLSAGEASFQDLILNIAPDTHAHIKHIRSKRQMTPIKSSHYALCNEMLKNCFWCKCTRNWHFAYIVSWKKLWHRHYLEFSLLLCVLSSWVAAQL